MQDPADTEERLAGGGVNSVSRSGDTVRRNRGPHSERVSQLLRHLESAGFTGAPQFLGIDEQGREVLRYLPGEVGNYPLSPAVRSEQALTSAARLLRRFHDATADLAQRWPDGWLFAAQPPVEVICHGDFAPYNCVFDGETAAGIIDFDTAHPGPRSRDIAYALYRFGPLTDPANSDGFGSAAEQAQRITAFCASYGPFSSEGLIEQVADRLRELVRFMRAEAANGNAAFAGHLADGHDLLYLRDVEYIEAQHDLFTAAVAAAR